MTSIHVQIQTIQQVTDIMKICIVIKYTLELDAMGAIDDFNQTVFLSFYISIDNYCILRIFKMERSPSLIWNNELN